MPKPAARLKLGLTVEAVKKSLQGWAGKPATWRIMALLSAQFPGW